MKQVHGGEAPRRTVVRPDISPLTPIVIHGCLTRSRPSKLGNSNHIARSFAVEYIVDHYHAPQCDSSYHRRTHTLTFVRGSEARSRQVTSAVREYAKSLRHVQTETKTRLPGSDTRGVQRSVVLHSPIIAAAPTTPVVSSPSPRAKSPSLIEDGHIGRGLGRKDEFVNAGQLGTGASLVVSSGRVSPTSLIPTAETLRKSLGQVLDEDEFSLLSGTMSGMGIPRTGQTTDVSVGSTTVIHHHRTEGSPTHTSTSTPFGSSSFPHALAGTSATGPDEDGKTGEQATSVLGSGSGIFTEERLRNNHAHSVREDAAAMLAVVGPLQVLPPPMGPYSSRVWPPSIPPTKFLSVEMSTSPVISIPDHPPCQERDLCQKYIRFFPLASGSSPPIGPHSSRVLPPGPRTPPAKVISVGIFTSPVSYVPDHPPHQERDLYQEYIGFIPLASVSSPPMGPRSSRVLPPGPRTPPTSKVRSVGMFTSPVSYVPDHPPRQERDLCLEYIGFSVFLDNAEATALMFGETLQGFLGYGRHSVKDHRVNPRAMDPNSDKHDQLMHNQLAVFVDFVDKRMAALGLIRMAALGLVPSPGSRVPASRTHVTTYFTVFRWYTSLLLKWYVRCHDALLGRTDPIVAAQSLTVALDDGYNQYVTAALVIPLDESTLIFALSFLRYFCSRCREFGGPESTCQTRSCHPGVAAAPSQTAAAWNKAKGASVNATLKLSTNALTRAEAEAAYELANPKPITSGPRTMGQLLHLQTLIALPPTLVLPLLHRTLAVAGAGVGPK